MCVNAVPYTRHRKGYDVMKEMVAWLPELVVNKVTYPYDENDQSEKIAQVNALIEKINALIEQLRQEGEI